MTTIGYGDLAPATDVGKIFTVFFAIAAVGTFFVGMTNVIRNYYIRRERQFHQIQDSVLSQTPMINRFYHRQEIWPRYL